MGPSLGPLIGGAATQLLSWRATFYFLCIFAGITLVSFVFFKDTFRRQRSLSYQMALNRHLKEQEEKTRRQHGMVSGNGKEKSPVRDVEANSQPSINDIRLSVRDISPFRPMAAVLRRRNNLSILLPSGMRFPLEAFQRGLIFFQAMIFGFSYCITYTVVLTLSAAPYSYGSLKIGLVLLSFGIGASRCFITMEKTLKVHVYQEA